MTDTKKRIAEIREALEKATPGPWKALDSCKGILWKYVQTNNGVITDNIRWQDAELIANAPEWLGFLLDELERLEREYAEEREKLINGLLTIVHYASEDGVHWKLDKCYTTARDILKEIGVTVE